MTTSESEWRDADQDQSRQAACLIDRTREMRGLIAGLTGRPGSAGREWAPANAELARFWGSLALWLAAVRGFIATTERQWRYAHEAEHIIAEALGKLSRDLADQATALSERHFTADWSDRLDEASNADG